MLTLTITLKGTEHQITLAFNSMETRDAAARSINDMSQNSAIQFVQVEDDYGQMATWERNSMLASLLTDAALHWKFRNKMTIIRAEAELALNQELGQRPDLKFLVGGARAEFGSK